MKKVIVVGGGKVGYYLVKTLLQEKLHVSVVELHPGRCEIFAEEFNVLTINGNGTDTNNLADAGADRADFLAAVTGKDEVNLIVCQIAKQDFKIPTVVARVNNPKNKDIFERLGINLTVSSTSKIAEIIQGEIAQQSVKTLLTFHRGEMVIVEMRLEKQSPATNKQVVELAKELPEGCILVSVIRGKDIIFPKGNTVLLPGDSIIALAHIESEQPLQRAVVGGKVR